MERRGRSRAAHDESRRVASSGVAQRKGHTTLGEWHTGEVARERLRGEVVRERVRGSE